MPSLFSAVVVACEYCVDSVVVANFWVGPAVLLEFVFAFGWIVRSCMAADRKYLLRVGVPVVAVVVVSQASSIFWAIVFFCILA